VIHRDVKPGNVMVLAEPAAGAGFAKLADFGVAHVATADELTRTGDIVGTLAYMAPEQAEGLADRVGTASDVYALGAILYFLLTLRPPFEGDAALSRVRGASASTPAPATERTPSTPRPLAAIAAKAMAVDPASRYASAQDLAGDVAKYLDGEPVTAYRETVFEKAARFFGRYRTPILLIAAYIVMRALLLIFYRR
jgi:serine/threonine protein kinase